MEDEQDQEERRRRLREQPVIGVEERDGGVLVRLGGELDLYNADQIRTALLEAAKRAPARLVLDLEQVEFIDSTVLGALIEARASLPDRRGLLLAAPGLETRRALQVSGLDRHLPVHDSIDEAFSAAP
jgi:anti-sigma B factor antagonist